MPHPLLTPRWIGRFGLLLVVVTACVLLGLWQWDQARVEHTRTPPAGSTPLTEVQLVNEQVDPDDAGRTVSLRGKFDPDRELLVVDRLADGVAGSWVVTAFIVNGSTEPDAVVPVVRGWLPAGSDAPRAPRGTQQLEGWLEPSESSALRDPEREPLPDGQVQIVSTPELLSLWQPPLYEGFVVQSDPKPEPPLHVIEAPERTTVVTDWQNAAYAVQWWIFGLFAIFWFVRMVRLESEERGSSEAPATDAVEQPGSMDA